eukprot:396434-Rhodomonas_salina.2
MASHAVSNAGAEQRAQARQPIMELFSEGRCLKVLAVFVRQSTISSFRVLLPLRHLPPASVRCTEDPGSDSPPAPIQVAAPMVRFSKLPFRHVVGDVSVCCADMSSVALLILNSL